LPTDGVDCGTVAAIRMDISLGRVLEAARERRATLTPEVAGYVILLAAQQVDAEPTRVSADRVLLDEAGEVIVVRDAAASERDIEAALRALLGGLIGLCVSPPPAIRGVASRAAAGDLRGLIGELSAALIPINHAAAHRALARLFRETRRAQRQVSDVSLQPISERRWEPEPRDLEIDVVVEAEEVAIRRDPPSPAAVEVEPFERALPHAEPEWPSGAESPEREPRAIAAEAAPAAGRSPAAAEPEPARLAMARGSTSIICEAPSPIVAEALDEVPWRVPSGSSRRLVEVRSDVYELLDAFLAETRSVEHMLPVLRDMIGLERLPPSTMKDWPA
jgi:hypothetical protein